MSTDIRAAVELLVAAQMPAHRDLIDDHQTSLNELVAAMAPSTRKAYTTDLTDYLAWLADNEEFNNSLDPAAIAAYLKHSHETGHLTTSSLRRRTASIHKIFEVKTLLTGDLDYDPTKHPIVKATIDDLATQNTQRQADGAPRNPQAR